MTSLVWFRRDLRLTDHPALSAAAAAGPVVGLFVIEPRLWEAAGDARRAWVAASLRSLDESTGGSLVIRVGDPATVVPEVARTAGAEIVHVTGETTPYGRDRDAAVAAALDRIGVRGQPSGTPYAVDPGTVRTQQGGPYQVFTPFSRAWREQGWPDPLPAPDVDWATHRSDADARARIDAALTAAAPGMLPAGEEAARERWLRFLADDLSDYDTDRDLPGADRTSRMSPYLKIGAVHPRQLLAELVGFRDGRSATSSTTVRDGRSATSSTTVRDGRSATSSTTGEGAVDRYATELAWRDFYADVLWHHPGSAWADLRHLAIDYDDPGEAFTAWQDGLTGFPIVDAGMRQLRHEGWMHNRVRMITASFLTKDLHAWWPAGARHFLDLLIDGDVASNNHGWQWVAGTGTDASPYFRVFNPVTQGKKFDPDGEYVRRWIPELAHLPGGSAHEPWKHPLGYEADYPQPIVDHAEERKVALERYGAR